MVTTATALRSELQAIAQRLEALGLPAALMVFVEDPALIVGDRREDFISTTDEVCEVGVMQVGDGRVVELEVRHWRPARPDEIALRGRGPANLEALRAAQSEVSPCR